MSDGVSKFVLAMGGAPGPGVNPYVQLIPIALVFAIFYFIKLLFHFSSIIVIYKSKIFI